MKTPGTRVRIIFAEGFQVQWQERIFLAAFALSAFLSLCGLVLSAWNLLPERFSWTASVVILLATTATFLSELRNGSLPGNLILLIAIVVAGFVVEFIGVRTGLPFGTYAYTDVLSLRLWGVPLAIAFAWYSTVMNTRRIAERICGENSPAMIAAVAGILTVSLDLVLEPAASSVNHYWIWTEGPVPVQNYLGWFAVSFVLVWLTASFESGRPGVRIWPTSGILFGLQVLHFALTDAVNGFIGVLSLAAGMIAAAAVFGLFSHSVFSQERSAQR